MTAYYQGNFVQIIGPTFGYVKVYSVDQGGGQVVGATYFSANNNIYGVHQASGICYGHSVQGFDGYVTVNGTQYEIQYSGTLNYP